ncbi:MAG: phosphatidylglycerophosphatase A [Roseomonas sp.]|nr:phosphatidylglycerophosphatase A [Roseomonas sp.]MCA3328762.1 phosphatidylglycerophosphatase A [Roseomonas sp.]MCA3333046.1 phosphatidylglycerophosphatase A [Roseomonas sp.]MCA3335881.1 phosphatidylglycerophosphatase A [Roseomonas sp.]MCA3345765.1 phosphatidylglycerophosphatase A [Roseomonas sp.]
MSLPLLVATLGGIGRLKPAPGTWGSLVVLPVALLGPLAALLLGLLVTLVGVYAVRAVLRETPDQDPAWIVVDEAAGMLLALAGLSVDASIWGMLIAFGLFRVFDILKPWPVSWADQQKGAFGVMLDDIVAGALVAAALMLARPLLPGVI